MNLSTWSIRHPVPPIALFLVLLLAGMFSFRSLAVTQFPNIDLPLVTVSVAQPGAAPSELITQVAQPIEDAIASVTGVRHTTVTATDAALSVLVEFELETDSDRAVNDIKDAVAEVRGDLPDDITEPVVRRLDVTGMPILTYAVRDQGRSIEELSSFVEDVIARELATVDAVGKVSRMGGADREIKVELDPDRLLAHGLTAASVSQQLRALNIDLGGGRGDLAGTEFSIRALGAADTLDQLGATPIRIGDGATIRLDQIGQIIDGASEERSFALYDGAPVVAFGVFRASGESDLEAAEGTKERLAELQQAYPSTEIFLIDDVTVYTEANFHQAMETLYEGAALAIIVVFLFLRNWRATLIAAVALPLSIIPTFFVMEMLGFTLNSISLLGITLVTGILVDDAIVEIENIVRHINMGVPAYEASEEAATEIGTTVIAISFSIVAVFAPVSFMSGIAGQYFKQFGLTVAVSVLFSLLVARIITPMMAAYLMKDAHHSEARDGFIMRGLMAVSGWTLRHRLLTLLAGVMIFIGSIYSATLLPTEFMPPTDIGRSTVTADLPPGATITDTEDVARRITRRLDEVPEVQSVFVEGGGSDVASAKLFINYGDKADRARSQFALEEEVKRLLSDMPDLRLSFQNENGDNDLAISVLGDSEAGAAEAAQLLADEMKQMPELEGVSSSANLRRPEITVTPKPDIAAQLGVTAIDLATTLRIATIGDSESNLAKFNAGDSQVPIMVRLDRNSRENLDEVRNLRVPSAVGQVPLEAVADVGISAGATEISRYDRRFRTSVTANLTEGTTLGEADQKVKALQGQIELPPGTEIQASGDAEIMGDIFEAFGTAMAAGILLVFVVLVLLFHSFITPISILLSLPLAIGGAIFGLYFFGFAMSLPVMIGFLMLMGIVTKNAIMLVEFALTAMTEGVPKREALLDAVHKRARPIVMTTIAMTAGMVPSAIGSGAGGEFRSPMAIAVIGGLLLSTLLSLLFVPALFSVIHGGQTRLGRFISRRVGINSARETEPAE
ncbi:hydrophobe/amphiphile efflux-1 (HAE1) family protein [Paracoccus isoporae]|uniref:Hydrophobe/amphiphile efflux-1 (HAE1) family protein n=1 Tax=Paracoccus isoporae TaxID=591205 RepID=A0A1G7AGU5_9RHOB|nr:efflux RND transporter permease subunit [Paracoccus isoporae]SDE13687.1 hydrophobe/amphiphile efflux-1 (HAE1) family protein [Paracoccus isoporae]